MHRLKGNLLYVQRLMEIFNMHKFLQFTITRRPSCYSYELRKIHMIKLKFDTFSFSVLKYNFFLAQVKDLVAIKSVSLLKHGGKKYVKWNLSAPHLLHAVVTLQTVRLPVLDQTKRDAIMEHSCATEENAMLLYVWNGI